MLPYNNFLLQSVDQLITKTVSKIAVQYCYDTIADLLKLSQQLITKLKVSCLVESSRVHANKRPSISKYHLKMSSNTKCIDCGETHLSPSDVRACQKKHQLKAEVTYLNGQATIERSSISAKFICICLSCGAGNGRQFSTVDGLRKHAKESHLPQDEGRSGIFVIASFITLLTQL